MLGHYAHQAKASAWSGNARRPKQNVRVNAGKKASGVHPASHSGKRSPPRPPGRNESLRAGQLAPRGGWEVDVVGSVNVKDDKGKLHTEYVIKVKKTLSWAVRRRYKNFEALSSRLKSKDGMPTVPSLPAKRIIKLHKTGDTAFTEKRRAGLDAFLKTLCAHPTTASQPEVDAFLACAVKDDSAETRAADLASAPDPELAKALAADIALPRRATSTSPVAGTSTSTSADPTQQQPQQQQRTPFPDSPSSRPGGQTLVEGSLPARTRASEHQRGDSLTREYTATTATAIQNASGGDQDGADLDTALFEDIGQARAMKFSAYDDAADLADTIAQPGALLLVTFGHPLGAPGDAHKILPEVPVRLAPIDPAALTASLERAVEMPLKGEARLNGRRLRFVGKVCVPLMEGSGSLLQVR